MKTFLKKTIALACFAMLMPLSLLAQDVLKVHGIVTDPSGEPLIGVNVKAASSSVGAVTDLDGKYSIEVSPKSTLTFSYVGFETAVESVKNRRQMDVTRALMCSMRWWLSVMVLWTRKSLLLPFLM